MAYKILFVFDERGEKKRFAEIIKDIADIFSRSFNGIDNSVFGGYQCDSVIDANPDDALMTFETDTSISAIVADWELEGYEGIKKLFFAAKKRSEGFPTFLLHENESHLNLPREIMELTDELILPLEDNTDFITGRIFAAVTRYIDSILPPFTKAMVKFAEMHEYSWHTPGHAGGAAFRKSAVGREFFDYYGEPLFRNDLSISVGELGSLLDHSGKIGESERYISKVFGSDRSYTVTNGTSTSNRTVYEASVIRDDIVLVDRNCHKSVEQSLTLTGARPAYLIPSRNYLGIIGPIPPKSLTSEAVQKTIAAGDLTKNLSNRTPRHATITNSTYDGLLYNIKTVLELLGGHVDRLHFDEAWYGYARFNPIYKDRFAMSGEAGDYDRSGPTVIATQSTHKLLAAFSQASYIHIRDGRNPIGHNRFNESFMMNASTSPFYPIIASNEVSAAMMDENGIQLTENAIKEAVDFRKQVMRYHRDFTNENEWFFTTWQPDTVLINNSETFFADIDSEILIKDPEAWILRPGESWHGYKDLGENYCMLDPVKVSIVTPGVKRDGNLSESGIPAALLSAYLDTKGIINEKTNDFTCLVLFSIGVAKGKWGTLLGAMLEFKRDYDENKLLEEVFPELIRANPERYAGYSFRQLADEMFAEIKNAGQIEAENLAFDELPYAEKTPQEAYQKLVCNEVEQVPLLSAGNRTVATGIVPYPPGIPLIMPGEKIRSGSSHMKYLEALEAFDRKFPGFEHDSHGIENIKGSYNIYILKE